MILYFFTDCMQSQKVLYKSKAILSNRQWRIRQNF